MGVYRPIGLLWSVIPVGRTTSLDYFGFKKGLINILGFVQLEVTDDDLGRAWKPRNADFDHCLTPITTEAAQSNRTSETPQNVRQLELCTGVVGTLLERRTQIP